MEYNVIKIAICDDEPQFCSDLVRTLIKILDKKCIEYDIDVFYSGVEIKKKIEIKKSSGYHGVKCDNRTFFITYTVSALSPVPMPDFQRISLFPSLPVLLHDP